MSSRIETARAKILPTVGVTLLTLAAMLTLSPSVLFAGWEEGVAALQAKDYRTAARELRAHLTEHPDDPAAHYLLGLSLGTRGFRPDALRHIHKARDLAPSDATIRTAAQRLALAGEELRKACRELIAERLAEGNERQPRAQSPR